MHDDLFGAESVQIFLELHSVRAGRSCSTLKVVIPSIAQRVLRLLKVDEYRLRCHEVPASGLADDLPVRRPAALRIVTDADAVTLADRLVDDHFSLPGRVAAFDDLYWAAEHASPGRSR